MRPTISLACILKNEVHNLPQLLASVEGCFDEIHLTDTGSTDGSIELIQSYIDDLVPNPAKSKIFLHKFEWVNDFAKARQASFDVVQTDYVMWMDLDDVLSDKAAFIQWRDSTLAIADFWMATYHYGRDNAGRPACSFCRERVVKRNLDFKWHYFIHEGMRPESTKKKHLDVNYVTCWNVQHKRTEEDLKADKSRNLSIFEKRKNELDPRMRYYYGKELYENKKYLEAYEQLHAAITVPENELELHDRIMGFHYTALTCAELGQFEKGIFYAHQGLQLSPERAEFFVTIGDCYIRQHKLKEAAAFYRAATECEYRGNGNIQGALFSHEPAYRQYPLNQLARIYAHTERVDDALTAVNKALTYGPDAHSIGVKSDLEKMSQMMNFRANKNKKKTEDIVITAHPTNYYEWDEEIYKTRGIGGSETAAVEMAHWLAKLTSRKVIVFNNRETEKNFGNVSYQSAIKNTQSYFLHNEPKVHIAWRHNVKFTDAPTYLWCHDLAVPEMQAPQFDKVLALSEFHKNYLHTVHNVPLDKIWVTGNGIDPKRWDGFEIGNAKTSNRVIYSSSPDRGLDRALFVMDEVVKEVPDAELHCYYGFDNLRKLGKHKEVEFFEGLLATRPWVKFHGNLPQTELTKEFVKSKVWLYPTTFLETFCITAIESLCAKVYPVTRRWGALQNTLADAEKRGMATLLDTEAYSAYAKEVVHALKEDSWKKINVSPESYSWESVARSWILEMKL